MTILQALGLQLSATPPANYATQFLIGNFLWSYMASNARWPKIYYGLDHNACPRQDLEKYAEAMVKEGKISRKTVESLKRHEAAQANNVEHFPFFVGTLLFACLYGLESTEINRFAALYTLTRIAYTIAYVKIEADNASYLRSFFWMSGNILCIWTLIRCGRSEVVGRAI